jgi:NADH:ubiquinone oxidoreductase subunit F (NADH-binding)
MTSMNVLQTPAAWPRVLLPLPVPADPANIHAAVKAGAFAALTRVVHKLGPDTTINAVDHSGLRGRGGVGFPSVEKWGQCATTAADRRYVVVHAYQADPAVMTDRVLLETNPYAVIEGAAIAAFAIDAREAFIALRAEAADTVRVLQAAVAAAEKAGYLGENVLDSGFDIDLIVKPLRGGYMVGEETVLLAALEGRRGLPLQQPPYPTTHGLYGRPTLLQNAQTFAAVPGILAGGPGAFASTGVRGSPGTILVQVSGSVASPGVAEVPLGATLREIVALAGGVPAPHRLKALLVGGPSGGILPPEALDTPYEYEALARAGAHIGSGSIVAVDERACAVALATGLTRYCADVACGKSIPCRIGLRRLAEIGDRICEGQPRGDELPRLTDLAADIVASGLCDHERNATRPLLSLARYFGSELDAHMLRGTCPAGVCASLAGAGKGAGAGAGKASAGGRGAP